MLEFVQSVSFCLHKCIWLGGGGQGMRGGGGRGDYDSAFGYGLYA